MATVKPMLDGVELPQGQRVAAEDEEVLAQHGVPGLEGDFLQDLGRRATRLTVAGVMTGAEAGEDLAGLREKYRAAAPVPFVADIATATRVDRVLIEELGVRELAGKPARFEYALALREFAPPPAVEVEDPPIIPPDPVIDDVGTLVVTVIVEGEPDFDFARAAVTARGTEAGGAPLTRTLANRAGNVWTEADFPPGEYTVEAVVTEPEPLTGMAAATVRAGETTEVTITLRPSAAIAKAFVVHFWFDKAFIEPCLREVMRRVAAHSDAHPDEKLLIVGHTDLVGDAVYNQSLSERRGQAAFAYLSFGRDRTAATREWDQLRRSRAGGGATIHDNWGVREEKYLLQDLGFYRGNVDETRDGALDAAIRAFQTDHGLTPDGVLGDATWPLLVAAYMEQDSLAVPEERFFRNAGQGCDGGVLKWLGCGEQDPVRNTEDAWRPNRRTEFLFVRADRLPCEVPRPVTFDLPAPGAVGSSWCLGPGNPDRRCCFTTRSAAAPDRWLIQPAEPGRVQVAGRIAFEDGSPVVHARYTLLAADGENLHTDATGKPDLGERPKGGDRGRPVPAVADEDGRFRHPRETPEGVYILEILDLAAPQVARATDQGPDEAVGNVVCLRFVPPPPTVTQAGVQGTGAPGAGAPAPGSGGVVQRVPVPAAAVEPRIAPAAANVLVRRSYTSPARVPITLRTGRRFSRDGTLDRAGKISAIRLFDAATGGRELAFDGADNVFTGAQLSRAAGVRLFAESDNPSDSVGDYVLTLTLAPGSTPVGPPATAALTAVRLTLDVFAPRPPSGVEPPALPQPPDPPPAAGTATDKWFGGRTLNLQDSADSQPRAMLRVRQVEPSDFAGDLVLRQVRVTGTTIGAAATRGRLFDDEAPAAGQVPHPDPFTFSAATVTILGRDLFLQGRNLSAADRDAGFQLGLAGGERDGDRVAFTVGVAASIRVTAATPEASALRAVVVRKAHTNPARLPITLATAGAFTRQVTLTRAGNIGAIRLFDAAAGGVEVAFNAANEATFSGARLGGGGLRLFAEGMAASGATDDVVLTLSLSPGSPAPGLPATLRLTAVELTLDVCLSRTAPAVDPVPMTAAAKVATGRFVQVADANVSHERAKLIARQLRPAGFAADLVLNALDRANPRVRIFTEEEPSLLQTRLTLPNTFLSGLTLADGLPFFCEARAPSGAVRDTGFQLGIAGLEDDGDRVPMTAVQFDVAEDAAAATPASRAVRFGLWDQAYDAAGNVRADFIDNDRRRFHFRVVGPAAAGSVQIGWRTVNADRTTNDDAPASELLTLPETAAGSRRFVSRGVLLVSDDTDAAQTTRSGLAPPLAVEPRARGASDHRLRRAKLDGFVRARFQPAAGQFHRLVVPAFDRAVPFTTTAATNVTPGVRVVTPAAMSGTAATGARWSIKAGSTLTVDTGANQEEIFVSAATATTFTANFANAHNGVAALFQIVGRTDERRRVQVRVVRYNNPADATYLSATNANVDDQFVHADRRWRQVGLQIDRAATQDRQIPAGALVAGRYPFSHPNGAPEQAALADLLPITPDDTLSVVFVHLTGVNAYSAILPTVPVPLPAGGTATMGNRYFIFINSRLDPNDETLAHELHHVLFNRGDAATGQQFFTFNTNPPNNFGIPLPDVRVYRRIQTLHTANPNVDANNDNTFNWHRRLQTARFPVAGDFNPAATPTTGNRFTGEF